MATNSPYNYDLQLQELARRQQMVEAMQSSALKPLELGPAAGGVQPKMNILSALAPMLQALMANKMGANLQAERTAMADRYQSDLRSGMEDFMNTSQGQTKAFDMPAGVGPEAAAAGADAPVPFVPGQSTVQTPGGGTEVTPGDPRKAMLDAIASNHPVLQQMGMSQLAQMTKAKEGVGVKDLLPYVQPSAIPDLLSQGVGGFKPKREVKETGGTFYDVGGDEPKPLGGQSFGQPVAIRGDLYQTDARTGKLVKLDNAAKTTVNVGGPVIQGENAFMKGIGEDTSKLVNSARTAKQAGQQMIHVAGQLEALDAKGVFSGPTANAATVVSSFAQTLGVPVDSEKLARSEAYQATLAAQVAKVLTSGSVGRTMTDEDRKKFEQQFPQLVNSPQGRQQIIGMLRSAGTTDIQYSDQVQQNLEREFPEAARLFKIAPSNTPYPVGGPAGQPAGAPGRVRRYNPATGKIE